MLEQIQPPDGMFGPEWPSGNWEDIKSVPRNGVVEIAKMENEVVKRIAVINIKHELRSFKDYTHWRRLTPEMAKMCEKVNSDRKRH